MQDYKLSVIIDQNILFKINKTYSLLLNNNKKIKVKSYN